jgi:hypothetical protein
VTITRHHNQHKHSALSAGRRCGFPAIKWIGINAAKRRYKTILPGSISVHRDNNDGNDGDDRTDVSGHRSEQAGQ